MYEKQAAIRIGVNMHLSAATFQRIAGQERGAFGSTSLAYQKDTLASEQTLKHRMQRGLAAPHKGGPVEGAGMRMPRLLKEANGYGSMTRKY